MSSTARPPSRLLSGAIAGAATRLLRSARIMRAPIHLYRARLGFLFGSRMLMLEHVGRRSGTRRRAVLEVVGHPAPDVYMVASGFGGRSQWFRNVQANPHVRVSVGRRVSAPAIARLVERGEADTVLAAYAARHPLAWRVFQPVLEATLEPAAGEHHARPPLIELRVTGPA